MFGVGVRTAFLIVLVCARVAIAAPPDQPAPAPVPVLTDEEMRHLSDQEQSKGPEVVTARSGPVGGPPHYELAPQLQADVGLAVIGIGYEYPIARHLAIMGEAQIFGTYFLPWFSAGDSVQGLGLQIRATWYFWPCGRGPYVMAFGRGDGVRGDAGDGLGISGGAAAGWIWKLTEKLDLRLGAGAQYIHLQGGKLATSTPFPTLDAVVSYRL